MPVFESVEIRAREESSNGVGRRVLLLNGNGIQLAGPRTIVSATAPGSAGELAWDAGFIYVCTATNTWKRVAIATW